MAFYVFWMNLSFHPTAYVCWWRRRLTSDSGELEKMSGKQKTQSGVNCNHVTDSCVFVGDNEMLEAVCCLWYVSDNRLISPSFQPLTTHCIHQYNGDNVESSSLRAREWEANLALMDRFSLASRFYQSMIYKEI